MRFDNNIFDAKPTEGFCKNVKTHEKFNDFRSHIECVFVCAFLTICGYPWWLQFYFIKDRIHFGFEWLHSSLLIAFSIQMEHFLQSSTKTEHAPNTSSGKEKKFTYECYWIDKLSSNKSSSRGEMRTKWARTNITFLMTCGVRSRLKNWFILCEKDMTLCIMMFELNNKMDVNRQSLLQCSLFRLVRSQHDASSSAFCDQRVGQRYSNAQRWSKREMEIAGVRKKVDLKFGLHHFRFM